MEVFDVVALLGLGGIGSRARAEAKAPRGRDRHRRHVNRHVIEQVRAVNFKAQPAEGAAMRDPCGAPVAMAEHRLAGRRVHDLPPQHDPHLIGEGAHEDAQPEGCAVLAPRTIWELAVAEAQAVSPRRPPQAHLKRDREPGRAFKRCAQHRQDAGARADKGALGEAHVHMRLGEAGGPEGGLAQQPHARASGARRRRQDGRINVPMGRLAEVDVERRRGARLRGRGREARDLRGAVKGGGHLVRAKPAAQLAI